METVLRLPRRLLIVIGVVGAAATLGTTQAEGAGRRELGRDATAFVLTRRGTVISSNWSGYAVHKRRTTFTDVQGSWVQPSATCPTSQRQYASFWVGIDGFNSNSVEQIGTDADCAGRNRPKYYAWYEMYPAPLSKINLSVSPGDRISPEVSVSGSTFTLSVTNKTTDRTFSTTADATARLSSAEWVAEAPSGCTPSSCTVLPLADFGTARFSGSYATGNGHTGSISDSAWGHDRIVMETSSGTVKARPSSLSSDGTAFSVAWRHS